MGNTKKLTLKTKLLIYEFKEKYPTLSAEEIIDIFSLDAKRVYKLFDEEYITISSKMNKDFCSVF
jgi:hypothetical protein